jgi:hypothetical protein
MAISGKTGSVVYSAGTLCATSWTVDYNVDKLDVTCFTGNGWKEFIAGLKEVTGSFVSLDDPSGVDPATIVAVTLANDDVSFSGSAFVSISVSTPVDGRVENTFDVTFTGSVSVT